MSDYSKYKERIRQKVVEKLDYSKQFSDEEVKEIIGEEILQFGRTQFMSLQDKEQLGKELFYSIRKLDILQELLDDVSVTEIMVNGTDAIFIEKNGSLFQSDFKFITKEKLEDVIQQIVGKCNRVVNEASPIVDARLENGARVNVVLAPVALNGPILTIRRFPEQPIQMQDLVKLGTLDSMVAGWLEKLVIAGYNIFISGGTGSGKTTFLNALSNYIPKGERIITIEDSAELQIQGIENLVRLETWNANVEGCQEITIRDLIKSSLRMRPSRIIVGETRGEEALDVLQAMGTGHDGSLSSGHSNTARDMLARLETMVLMGMELPLPAIKRQIASGIDLILHLGRLRDKSRKLLEVVEIIGFREGEILTQTLFEYQEKGEDDHGKIFGALEKKAELFHKNKLLAAGITWEWK